MSDLKLEYDFFNKKNETQTQTHMASKSSSKFYIQHNNFYFNYSFLLL